MTETQKFTMYTIQERCWYGTGYMVLPVVSVEDYEDGRVVLSLIDGNEITVETKYQDLHETTGEELFYLPVDYYYENGWWRA